MKGFSLIELIIVIAIIGIIGSISMVTYNTMRKMGDVKHAAYVLVDSLKEAKNKAKMMEFDTDWGVNILTSDITVFSGSSYVSRDSVRDKIYDIPANLNITGPTEIVFTKFTGLPASFGEIIFTNDFGTSSVNILPSGAVSY
jgi:prepilin-type N-terminal cleavage/methylation domain-containing protein